MLISEYDAFGPWVYEISEEHSVPQLFAPFIETEPALMQIKIPRQIERRKATPDMDLYDYVLSAYPSRLVILERTESAVQKTEIPYQEIQAIQIYREFLKGVLAFYLRSQVVTVPFNTVSIDIMLRLVNLIREHYVTGQANFGTHFSEKIPEQLTDILFVNLLKDLQQQGEQITGGAWQPTVSMLYCGSNKIEKLRNRIRKPLLQGALHLSTPHELLIIEHEKQTQKDNKRSYGYNYTYIPWNNLKSVNMEPDNHYLEMTALSLALIHRTLSFHFESGNQSIAAFYEKIQSIDFLT